MGGREEGYELGGPKSITDVTECLTKQFQLGRITQVKLWQSLESLVEQGELSRADRRRIFWDTHSHAGRVSLRERCSYFNPHDDLWRNGNVLSSPATEEQADNKLLLVMGIACMDEAIAQRQCWFSRCKTSLGYALTVSVTFGIDWLYAVLFEKDRELVPIFSYMFLLVLATTTIPLGAIYWGLHQNIASKRRECATLRRGLLYPV